MRFRKSDIQFAEMSAERRRARQGQADSGTTLLTFAILGLLSYIFCVPLGFLFAPMFCLAVVVRGHTFLRQRRDNRVETGTARVVAAMIIAYLGLVITVQFWGLVLLGFSGCA